MGVCYSRGDTELKASFGKGNEFHTNSPVEEFNKRYFEIQMDYDNKFEVFEGMSLLFLYWYHSHIRIEKKKELEQNETHFDSVNYIFIQCISFIILKKFNSI